MAKQYIPNLIKTFSTFDFLSRIQRKHLSESLLTISRRARCGRNAAIFGDTICVLFPKVAWGPWTPG